MKETLQFAEDSGMPIRRLRAGDVGDWPGNMAWETLWPPEAMKLSCADDAAMVLRVARYGVAILLAGDAGAAQENAMRARGTSLAASVLVAGRHGDAGATSAAWLDAVRPKEAIISAGPHSDARHPDDETLSRLAEREARIWRTDRQGVVHVELAGAPARWPKRGYRIWSAIP